VSDPKKEEKETKTKQNKNETIDIETIESICRCHDFLVACSINRVVAALRSRPRVSLPLRHWPAVVGQ